jgi:CTP synthase (UTP-ammonia lyase)
VAQIALIGDYNSAMTAHRAIPMALARAADEGKIDLSWRWIETAALQSPIESRLAGFAGVWCVPASPYANTAGALGAIGWAREMRKPFLGTCGGFQHALLEYAQSCWNLPHAAHAELDPTAANPVIAPLSCSMVEVTGAIKLVAGSRLAAIYKSTEAVETYHCRYGLSAQYVSRLDTGPLHVSATDEAGDVRAIELIDHPFFLATLFQPERAALADRSHQLIAAFARAVVQAPN